MSSPFLEPQVAPLKFLRSIALVIACAIFSAIACVVAPGVAAAPVANADSPPLRVCADPDNLPYSHRDQSGFENRIAALVADELQRPLQYHWQPQQRGFVRKTMGSGFCDLFIGVPVDLDQVLTTRPYYRSSYVFVQRVAQPRPLLAFDDPRLSQLRIGVQLVGDDLAATPPGYALARAGAIRNVIGYPVLGAGPAAARMMAALADDRLDVALVWGPQAGWHASHSPVPLAVQIATAPAGLSAPFEFSIAMGVRRKDTTLRDAIDGAIDRRRTQIDAILRAYAVPRTDETVAP
jgi:mxaJ protein